MCNWTDSCKGTIAIGRLPAPDDVVLQHKEKVLVTCSRILKPVTIRWDYFFGWISVMYITMLGSHVLPLTSRFFILTN